jgi:integrase
MRDLSPLVGEYVRFRSSRGLQPNPKIGHLLQQFVASLPAPHDEGLVFSGADALAWANAPAGAKDAWIASRLSTVRQFAVYLAGSGLPVGVPPTRQVPASRARSIPYIYSDADVEALMNAADALFTPVRASTMRTHVGLLAVTGMRIGETLRIEIGDIDLEQRTLLIRHAKGDRQRLVCLDATACAAVERYLAFPPRRRFGGGPDRPLFTTVTGTALGIGTVHSAFHSMTGHAGLSPRAGARPRLHDLRHTFATRTMIDAYETGRDPASTLAALAIWLGHSSPAYTYWYLQAVPELAAIAARRLEPGPGDIR